MKKKIVSITILVLILLALIILYIDKSVYKEYSKNYIYMDTYINIKITSTKSKREIDKIFEDIDYLYSSYHKLTNRYEEYDGIVNVYYLNEKLKDNEEIEIDKRLSDIIKIGISYYDKTNGLFNIASGNLTGIWKEILNTCEELPTEKELNTNININDISLEGNKYIKKNNVKIDLGGLAKGYVTELVGNYLEENKISDYIINAGGNVKVGKSKTKETYIIGITNPDNTDTIFTKVKANNLSIVTSGEYQRYCILDNQKYNHIIDPTTKHPSKYMKSVTVITKSSTLADIYSTYLYLLPVEEGLKIVNYDSNIEAIWYIDKENIVRSDNYNYE